MKQGLIMAFILAGVLFAQVPAREVTSGSNDAPSFVTEGTINAPIQEIWSVWTSGTGYTALGPAKADVDFRIGGLIRSHYDPAGVLGDERTIVNRILAYEPLRMVAIRIERQPRVFPFKEAWKQTWTVITMTDLGDRRTHLRVASMGFGTDEESVSMRHFFEVGNAATIKTLQSHFDAHKAGR